MTAPNFWDSGPWLQDSTAANYTRPAARPVVQLDQEATDFIVAHHRSVKSPSPLYILIHPEGNLVYAGDRPTTTSTWEAAIEAALVLGSYIYNARNKRASQPCWSKQCEVARRVRGNMTFAQVRLIPQEFDLPNVYHRLFEIDDFGNKK